jgi:hypothetical protein
MEPTMNTKDIRLSPDPDMAESYAAMQRAGRSVEDLAIRTNTAIITMIDGHVARVTAEEIIKRREAARNISEASEE